MERSFKRDIIALNEVFEFIQEYVQCYQLSSLIDFTIKFVIEELFTNMVKYNQGRVEEILIRLDKADRRCIITMIDHSSAPFDIRDTPEIDITQPAEERMIGGLGIHLVKKMVDTIDYEYSGTESKIILTKNLE